MVRNPWPRGINSCGFSGSPGLARNLPRRAHANDHAGTASAAASQGHRPRVSRRLSSAGALRPGPRHRGARGVTASILARAHRTLCASASMYSSRPSSRSRTAASVSDAPSGRLPSREDRPSARKANSSSNVTPGSETSWSAHSGACTGILASSESRSCSKLRTSGSGAGSGTARFFHTVARASSRTTSAWPTRDLSDELSVGGVAYGAFFARSSRKDGIRPAPKSKNRTNCGSIAMRAGPDP
jgi:hypothetical protein